jgi:hypothetical protein
MSLEKRSKLNAIGKPYSENFDPNYRMKYKPSYGHLRMPYGPSMKFVGDDPAADESRRRYRPPKPAPLLGGIGESPTELSIVTAIKLLLKIERKLEALQHATIHKVEQVECSLQQVREQLGNSGAAR